MKKTYILIVATALAASIGAISCKSEQKPQASEAAETSDATTAATENAAVYVRQLHAGDQINPAEGDKPVIIDFNATWCGPCKRFAPNFLAGAEKYAGRATFLSIDVDECPEIAGQFGIESIPAIVFILPSGEIRTHVGYMEEEQFFSLIEKNLE